MAKQLVYVSTNEKRGCPLCNEDLDGMDHFENACNHLLEQHGLKRLHVGQETHPDSHGNPWHHTVAVFGD